MNKKIENVNLDGFIEGLEKKASEVQTGIIKEIVPITNSAYFGEEGMFGEKEGFSITVALKDDPKTDFTQWFSKPNIRGVKQSNLYAFYKKYGDPKVKLEVEVGIDDNGFFRIVF